MRNTAAVLLIAGGLTACAPHGGTSEANAGPTAERASLDPAKASSADDYVGRYALAYANGDKGVVRFLADGKIDGAFNGQSITATYTAPGPGKVCFDNVSTGDPPHCWTNAPADKDGAWTATLDDGSTLRVTPVP